MKKKYYLIGLLALGIFIIAYHFYAARQAEEQIGEAIREQVEKNVSSTSVTYSSIDVSPFDGDIRFDDLSIVDSASIQHSRSVRLDLDYADFLNIYFRDLKYGLEQLSRARVTIDQPSYVSRSSFREMKFGMLHITFQGNAWDVFAGLANSMPLKMSQSFELDGKAFTYHIPNSLPGTVKAEIFNSKHSFPVKKHAWWQQGEHRAELNQLVWTPPASFQEQYGFFIRGFGYQTDHIPADSLRVLFDSSDSGTALISADLFTGLFDAQISSQLFISPDSLASSRFEDGTIDILDKSSQFDAFLKNLEQLLGLKLPEQSTTVLRFSGPLDDPHFTIQQ